TDQQFRISPDSSRVVYVADAEVDGVAELYSVPLDGSAAPVKLNGALVSGGDVRSTCGGYAISPDSTSVAYRAHEPQHERFAPFAITSDSTRVVYMADAEIDGQPELFATPIDGSAAPTRLGLPRGFGDYTLCPDGTALVFRTSSFPRGIAQLYFVALDGSVA